MSWKLHAVLFLGQNRIDPQTIIMRLTCMFSFILLFGAAGLVVFIHLQDPEEIVHQQIPGKRSISI